MKRPRAEACASPALEGAAAVDACAGSCELLLATPRLSPCLPLQPDSLAASPASSFCSDGSCAGAWQLEQEQADEEPCTPRGAIMSGPPPLPPAPSKARRAAPLPAEPLHAAPAPAPAWHLLPPAATRRRLYGAAPPAEAQAPVAQAAVPPQQLTGAWYAPDVQDEVRRPRVWRRGLPAGCCWLPAAGCFWPAAGCLLGAACAPSRQ